jgi:hypothetical protein
LFVSAQLRDVLAAEDSAVVTQEDNHRWLAEPQGAQPDFPTVGIRKRDQSKAAIEGVHAQHSF